MGRSLTVTMIRSWCTPTAAAAEAAAAETTPHHVEIMQITPTCMPMLRT